MEYLKVPVLVITILVIFDFNIGRKQNALLAMLFPRFVGYV